MSELIATIIEPPLTLITNWISELITKKNNKLKKNKHKK